MAGWIEQHRFPTQPLYVLNDRTGQTALVLLPGHDIKTDILGKFIKLYARKTHRDLVAHKWYLQDKIPFKEEIGLYYEASRIRENLLMGELENSPQSHRWISEYQFPSFDPTLDESNNTRESYKPHTTSTKYPPISQLLSLSRGTLLIRHPSFQEIAAISRQSSADSDTLGD